MEGWHHRASQAGSTMLIRVPPGGSESAARALAQANWGTLLPRLLRCASHTLRRFGWAETTLGRHSALEAQELVDMAVESCLAGERQWLPEPGATEDEIVTFLYAIMYAISTNVRTSHVVARRVHGDVTDIVEPVDEAPSAERIVAARARLAQVKRELEGDPEALSLCLALEDFPDGREGIARALTWTVHRLSVVRRRLTRHLAAKGLTYDEDDEAGPPSPSPQRRDHENPQAAGERRRAPRQPDGGRRLAGRRR
jgi:hypothetical protein